MTLALAWALAGSLGMNIMWLRKDKRTTGRNEIIPYVKGMALGLLLGPIALVFSLMRAK